jgi:hypothetical protein
MITTQEIVEIIKDFYSQEGNGAGGYLHCALDDGNLEDHDIKYCIKFAKEHYDLQAIILGYLLLLLTYEQREEAYKKFWE